MKLYVIERSGFGEWEPASYLHGYVQFSPEDAERQLDQLVSVRLADYVSFRIAEYVRT